MKFGIEIQIVNTVGANGICLSIVTPKRHDDDCFAMSSPRREDIAKQFKAFRKSDEVKRKKHLSDHLCKEISDERACPLKH